MTNIKYYKRPGGHEEVITETIQKLEEVCIIKPMHSPFNTPVWPVKKPEGTCRVMTRYWELNKVAPSLHAAGSSWAASAMDVELTILS